MPKQTSMAFSIDTSGFTKGLKEAQDSLKMAKLHFEANTASLDQWSKSTEGLREKIKLLATQQEAYGKKVEVYKSQISALSEAYDQNAKRAEDLRAKKKTLEEAGDTESKSYRAICSDLKATESAMQSQQAQMDKHRQKMAEEELALQRTQGETERWTGRLEELEQAEKQTTAEGGNLSAGIDEVGENAEKTGASIGDTASALQEMFTKAIEGVVEVAKACIDARQEVDSAYDTIAQGTGATGENLDKLKESADRVFGKMPDDMDTVGTAIADINTYFGLSGEKLEDCTEKFLKFNKATGSGTESIGQVKKMMADAGIPLENYGQVLDQLTVAAQGSGLSVSDLCSGVQQTGEIFRQFGLTTEEQIALLGTMNQQGVNSSKVITGMGAMLKNCTKDQKNASKEWEKFVTGVKDGSFTMEDAVALFGTKNASVMMGYAKDGKLSIDQMTKAIQSSSGQVEASYGEIHDSMDDVKTIQNQVKGASAVLGEVMLEKLSPIIDVVGKIAEKFLDMDEETLSKVSAGIDAVCVALGGLAVGLVATKIATGISALSTAVQTAGGIWQFFNTVLMANPLMLIVTAITAVVSAFVYFYNSSEDFRAFIDGLLQGIQEGWTAFMEWLGAVPQMLSDWWASVTAWVSEQWTAFTAWMAKIPEAISQMGAKIGEWISKIPEKLAQIVKWLLELDTKVKIAIAQMILGILQKIGQFFADIWNKLTGFFGQIWGKITGFFDQIVQGIGSWAGSLFTKARQAGQKLWDGLWGAIKSLPEKVVSLGGDIVKGIWNGISNMAGWIWDKISGFAGGIVDGFKNALGIHSPSRAFAEQAMQIPAGIAMGIQKASGAVYKELDKLADGMVYNFSPNIGITGGSASAILGAGQPQGGYVIYNQTINSPQQLDLRELNRQSRNLLAFTKG